MGGIKKNLIGANLRRLRIEADWTQDGLAGALQRMGWDLTRGTLAKIEAGLRRVNDGELLLLATCLSREPADLLKGAKTAHAVAVARQGRD
jgi:transcriptional regulator with XRE-family HTH domain